MNKKMKGKSAKERERKRVAKERWENFYAAERKRTQKEFEQYGLGGHAFTRKRIGISLMSVLFSVYGILNKTLTRRSGGCSLAKKEVYPFLEGLFRHKGFCVFDRDNSGMPFSPTCDKPELYDSPLYFAAMQGDRKMLEFLFKHVDRDAPYHQGLYDAVLRHYLYMKLPDWGGLAEVSGSQEKLLEAVEKQADSISVKRSPVLRTLLEAGFPSKCRKLPLKHSKVHIRLCPDADADPERSRRYHVIVDGMDWTVTGNGRTGYYNNDDHMVRALTESGAFYPFTCECGYEECADLQAPIQCLNTPTGMRWYKPYPRPMSCIVFDPKPVLAELEHAMSAIEKELKTDWLSSPEKKYDWNFPYGPDSLTPCGFKKDLAFCRRHLNRIRSEQSGRQP